MVDKDLFPTLDSRSAKGADQDGTSTVEATVDMPAGKELAVDLVRHTDHTGDAGSGRLIIRLRIVLGYWSSRAILLVVVLGATDEARACAHGSSD